MWIVPSTNDHRFRVLDPERFEPYEEPGRTIDGEEGWEVRQEVSIPFYLAFRIAGIAWKSGAHEDAEALISHYLPDSSRASEFLNEFFPYTKAEYAADIGDPFPC